MIIIWFTHDTILMLFRLLQMYFFIYDLNNSHFFSGILVNGQVIGEKKISPNGEVKTYFWRFGIVHKTLGVRLEVSTKDISVFQDGKWVKLLWSDTASVKGPK